MKRNLFFIAIILITAASCVKDRIQPAAGPVVVSARDTLMYFWSFNSSDTLVDFPAHSTAAYLTYNAAYADYTGGSKLNLIGITDSGQCLRVRNPSTDIVFHMPTTGYDSVIFSFAEQASSLTSGSTTNAIQYTTDGVTYGSSALGNNQYSLDTMFTKHSFSFATDPAVNNNPKFAVKITFVNQNTGTKGNDRFDNVSLSGVRK